METLAILVLVAAGASFAASLAERSRLANATGMVFALLALALAIVVLA